MPAMTKIARLDDLNFYHVVAETIGHVLVFFTAPHCSSCRSLYAVLQHPLLQADDLQVFEIDAVQNGGLVAAFEVWQLPAMFLYIDGHYHCELHSEALPSKLLAAIRQASSLPAEDEP